MFFAFCRRDVSLSAMTASERTLPCMIPKVCRQARLLRKLLVAFLAHVWLVACVGPHVNHQCPFLTKCLGTLGTRKRQVARVPTLM